MMTRRQAIKSTALASAALAVLPGALAQGLSGSSGPPATAVLTGPFTLPPLPYAYDALEPHIDAQTMQIHHDKHHAAYVANLNKAFALIPNNGHDPYGSAPSIDGWMRNLDSVPENVRTAVRNNGGGHYNHSLFWQMMKKDGGGEPTGSLAKAIDNTFGSFSAFKETFIKAALGQFGSGWVWLVVSEGRGRALKIESTPNQDTPLSQNTSVFSDKYKVPVLGLDVWEHAYYLKYQNKRADYITAWFNVVNWDFASTQYNYTTA